MKRLITFLKHGRSIMTLLLLFATISGIWANNYLYLWENGQEGNFHDMGGGNTCIIKNLKANTTYGVLISNKNTFTDATKWGATSDNQNSPMTAPYQNVTLDGHADFYFKTSVAGDYTFTATWSGNNPTLSIVASPGSTGETAFYLVGDLPGAYWSINDNFKFSPDGTDYSITLKGSDVSGKKFKLKSKTGITESFIAGPSSENNITLDSPVAFTGDGGKDYVFPQLDSNAEYIMTLTMTSSSAGEFVVKKKDSSSAKYYLIVPNANVENTNRYVPSEEFAAPAGHKAFRLKASRERNSTVINNDLTTLALKLDGRQLRYNTNGEIEFYIQSSDGTVYMQPKNNDDDTYIKLALKARNDVDYYATRTGTYSSNQNRYYKIRKNDTNPTDGSVDTKTLVFMFSKGNASKTAHINNDTEYNKNVPISKGNSIDGETTGRYDTGKDLKYNVGKDGNLIVGFLMSRGAGSKYYEDHIKGHGLYLVGSIAQKEYTHDKSHPMEKRYWKDGRIVELSDLGNDEAKADSIVYNCLVRNTGTDRSWDDFFLSFSTGDVVEGTGLWNLLLRPCVQDQMDAQELGGGVTFYQYDGGDKNNGQSLNPLLTAEQKARYVSYRVYFNATYSTYRIEFNDAFYIAGPAVNGSTDSGNSGTSFDKEHRYAMKKVTANGEEHYTYMGYFKKGGSFAFLVNDVTTTSNYSEDENALQLKDGNAESAWNVQAPGNGGDYAFYNKVKWNNGTGGTDNESLGTGNKAILWNLPDGYYTIRFYYGGTSGPKSDKTALYTVDKSVKISNVTVNVAETEKNYGGWMPFSDDCALWLPSNIKAYYAYDVKEETDGKKIVQLRELKGGYVPANCGVLLRNEDLTEKGAVERLNYMPVPAGYTKSFEDYKSEQGISDNNLLMDCSTTDKCVELDQVKDGDYNYFFTYKYKDADKNGGEFFDVPLNFWKVYPGEKPNKNSSYLHVAKQVTPLEFNVTDNNYYIADSEKVANSKGAYCLLFSIDDIDDNETTGIRVISPAADNDTNTDGWYNMQGMRVSKPTTAGIYINNGKKVVIK